MRNAFVLVIWLQIWLAGLAMAQGTVSGVLNDDSGKPFRDGARIMIMKVAEKPEGFTPFVSHAVTNKNGQYQIGGVPAGKYELCIWTSGGEWVNMCRWGKAAATTLVANGGRVVVNLSLTRGKVFTIDLEDADGYLERHENKSIGGFLDVGVMNDQKDLVEADLASVNKMTRKYRVVVPVGVRFRVKATSPLFDIVSTNEVVQALRVMADQDQMIQAQDSSKGVTLKVNGVKTVGGK